MANAYKPLVLPAETFRRMLRERQGLCVECDQRRWRRSTVSLVETGELRDTSAKEVSTQHRVLVPGLEWRAS